MQVIKGSSLDKMNLIVRNLPAIVTFRNLITFSNTYRILRLGRFAKSALRITLILFS